MSYFSDNKRYVIALVIGLGIAALICVGNQIWAAEDIKTVLRIFSDAFFVPGVLLLGAGILLAVVNEGLFNGVAFGLKTLGRSLTAKKGEKIREEEFFEYNMRMKEKKIPVVHLIVVGILFIGISLMLVLIYGMH